ncbi:helix-hairpin-helix domain-containing protein [Salinispirillum sp. LH 10-3-1]|uniref:Helix-hairpin-helix domain-containing protein n=1 Tax=Salinispirillum sp. LH 10-3-1 TaxID=2952525 RepID=A0AB38YKT1_9GAMM
MIELKKVFGLVLASLVMFGAMSLSAEELTDFPADYSDELVIMVNINLDDAEKMAVALAGIGPARAAAIVAHREEFGPFASVEDLLAISGIGPRTLEAIRHQLVVGDS